MSMEFSIRDRDGKGSLTFHWDRDDRWVAVLTGPALLVRRDVYAPSHGRFDRLFVEMAAAWRGWVGEKVWDSAEHEVTLSCTSDGLGHVRIAVTLRTDPMFEWRAAGVLVVEAGQLDALSKEAAEFLDEGSLHPM